MKNERQLTLIFFRIYYLYAQHSSSSPFSFFLGKLFKSVLVGKVFVLLLTSHSSILSLNLFPSASPRFLVALTKSSSAFVSKVVDTFSDVPRKSRFLSHTIIITVLSSLK